MNLREPFTFNMRAAFQELMDTPARRAHGRVPRSRVAGAGVGRARRAGAAALPLNFDSLAVAESDAHPELVGRKVVDIADERGGTPLDVMLDLSLEENLETRFCERARQQRPRRDRVAAPAGHGAARPGRLGRARQPAVRRVLRHRPARQLGARQAKSCRSSARSTSSPASRPACSASTDRGTLEVGKAADVVVFDADTVAPGPLRRIRDFPADGERLVADAPVGVRHVLVNGMPIREDGTDIDAARDARPGRMLRS